MRWCAMRSNGTGAMRLGGCALRGARACGRGASACKQGGRLPRPQGRVWAPGGRCAGVDAAREALGRRRTAACMDRRLGAMRRGAGRVTHNRGLRESAVVGGARRGLRRARDWDPARRRGGDAKSREAKSKGQRWLCRGPETGCAAQARSCTGRSQSLRVRGRDQSKPRTGGIGSGGCCCCCRRACGHGKARGAGEGWETWWGATPGAAPMPPPPRAVAPRTARNLVDPASSVRSSQRLSHASLSLSTLNSETVDGSLYQL